MSIRNSFIGLILLLAFTVPVCADGIYNPGGSGGGGGSTITANSTPTSGFGAGTLAYSDGSLIQASSGIVVAGVGQLALTLGTITTNQDALNITATWNNAGTTFDAPIYESITNTASAAGSKIIDLQADGFSQFALDVYGALSGNRYISWNGSTGVTVQASAGALTVDGPISAGGSLTLGATQKLGVTGDALINPTNTSGVAGLTINANAAAPTNGIVVHAGGILLNGADNNYAAFYGAAYGGYRVLFEGYGANGTGASPAASTIGDELVRFSGRGYGTTEWTGTLGAMSIIPAQNISDTEQGVFTAFRTTPLNQVGGGSLLWPPVVGSFAPSGALLVGAGQTVATLSGAAISGTSLTFSSSSGGTVAIGQLVEGAGVAGNTFIASGSGTSWTVTTSQSVSSETMTTTVPFATNTANDTGAGTVNALNGYDVAGASVLNGTTLGSSVVASSLTSVGALVSGSLASGFTVVQAALGGTGVNNGSSTLTLGASLVTTGTSVSTFALPSSGTPTYTFPTTTATLARTDVGQTFTGINYFTGAGSTLTNNVIVGFSATTSSGAGQIEIVGDIGAATNQGTMRLNNSATANSFLFNIPSSLAIYSSGTSSAGLFIGSLESGSPVVIFAGGSSKTASMAFDIVGPTNIEVPNIAADTGQTDTSVCQDTTNHTLWSGSGTLGVCLGTSSLRYKHDVRPLDVGLAQIAALQPISYELNANHGDPNHLLYGFSAEQGGSVLPDLMGRDASGRPNTFDYLGVVPVIVSSIQQIVDSCRAAANDNFCRQLLKKVNAR